MGYQAKAISGQSGHILSLNMVLLSGGPFQAIWCVFCPVAPHGHREKSSACGRDCLLVAVVQEAPTGYIYKI